MTLEERFEQLMKDNAEKEAPLEYLRRQLEQAIRNNRREVHSSCSTNESNSVKDGSDDNPFALSEYDRERRPRRIRRGRHIALNFKVEILEFESQVNPNEFIDWMNTVERMFDYNDVPDDKKVKLIALKLRKYASI